MTYRAEIDGLRAFAVLSVVLYHFDLGGLNGGFAGVDIFFVISGFLIGGILWDEWNHSGSINLARFYIKRIRRLAPAFFAMVLTTAALAYAILLPFEFRELGKSIITATLWMANIQFFRESGYFDIGSQHKILLHTWSLAVEEQFYVALPLALLLLRKKSKAIIASSLIAAWAASLVACIVGTPVAPDAAFFLFPFRAWELLTGVLLAILAYESRSTFSYSALISWGGAALLAGSITLLHSASSFPGWQAAIPVLGTALLIINSKNNNSINAVLASKIPTFIGLISYSLYLWHWPIFTLSTYWRGSYSGLAETAAWILFSLTVSIFAWWAIERPVRRMTSNRWLIILTSGFAVLTLGIGLWAYKTDGAPERFDSNARIHIDASNGFFIDWSRCSISPEGALQGLYVCTAGPAGPPQILFWGDSHLRAMMKGIGQLTQEIEIPALIVWHAGCPPLFGLVKKESAANPAQDKKCLTDTEKLRRAVATMHDIKRIVLIGRWNYYASGEGFGIDKHNKIEVSALPGSGVQGGSQSEIYASAWRLTKNELANASKEIIVMRQPPEFPEYNAREIARRIVHGQINPTALATKLKIKPEELSLRISDAETPIRRLALNGEITLIDTWPALCTPECAVLHNQQSYYFDNNHLSNTGATALRHLLLPALATK